MRTYLGFPFKLLPLTDSEGRHLSFLRAASNQNQYKLLSSLQTSPVRRGGPQEGILGSFSGLILRVSVANVQTANYTGLPLLAHQEQEGVNVTQLCSDENMGSFKKYHF